MEEEVPSKAVPPRSAKRDRRAEGKKERQPELTGPQKAQAALQEMIPNKFNSEGHLRQIYLVLVAACKEEDGSSVPKLACETGLGRVQLQEYLTVLVRCNQLLKMRTKVRGPASSSKSA